MRKLIALASLWMSCFAYGQAIDHSELETFPLLGVPSNQPAPLRSEPISQERVRHWVNIKSKILADFQDRVSPEFAIAPGLLERTAFWFDIYTFYGEAHHIIHHVRYPWIVYKVYDTTQTLMNSKGPLWLRRDRAEKLARAEADKIRRALKRLAARKSYDKLPSLEKQLFDKLAALPGPRKAVIKLAADNVRSQLGQRDFFEHGLKVSTRYLPYMEAEFRRRNLPTELTRMPFVESSFNVEARSRVGASGIWQIMPQTGRSLMIVNDMIDERNSPLKATVGAARLLAQYYRALGSWELTITSYNHGIGNIQKAIRAANSRDLSTIIARYHRGHFKFASSNFYTCFLAAVYAEKYAHLIFRDTFRDETKKIESVRLATAKRPRELMRWTGLTADELLTYNIDLRQAFKRNALLPKGISIFLPAGTTDQMSDRMVGDRRMRKRSRG